MVEVLEQIKRKRSVKVFVSSTFRDMHGERDMMMLKVFPKIRKLCEQRGVLWSEIDLRWGITEEEKDSQQVLPICLRRIDDSRPIFIGLVGERYGWTLKEEEIPAGLLREQPWLKDCIGKSITEIEFLYGALQNPTPIQNSFFYMKESTGGLQDEEDLSGQEQLEALKTRLQVEKAQGNIELQSYSNFDELEDKLLNDLTQLIEVLFPLTEEVDELSKEELEHETVARYHTRAFVDRPEATVKIQDFIERNSPYPLFVVGKPGCGKTTILAKWTIDHNRTYAHYIGANGESASPTNIVQLLLRRISRDLHIDLDIPASMNEVEAKFTAGLFKIAQHTKEKITIIIDGIDKVLQYEGGVWLTWLPTAIPHNISLIISTVDDKTYQTLQQDGFIIHELILEEESFAPLRETYISSYLDQYGKKLDPAQVNQVIENESTKSPLYLRFLLEELRLFGDFEQLEDELEKYLASESIKDIITNSLQRLQAKFYEKYGNIVKQALQYLSCAKFGLSEKELLDLLGKKDQPLPSAIWSPIYLNLESYLHESSGLIRFSHPFVQDAVDELFLTEKEKREIHIVFAHYFDKKEEEEWTERMVWELPSHLIESEQWETLYELLQDEEFLITLDDADSYALLRYWAILEGKSTFRKKGAYHQVLSQFGDMSDKLIEICTDLFNSTDMYEEALLLMQELEKRARKAKIHWKVSAYLNNQANIYIHLEQFDKAIEFYDKAELLLRKTGKLGGISTILNNKGHIMSRLGKRDLALQLHQQAAREAKRENHKTSLASSYNSQAVIYKDSGDFDKALPLFKEAEYIIREYGEIDGLATLLNNIGSLHHDMDQNIEAMEYFKESERLCTEIGDRSSLASTLNNKAMLLEQLGDRDGAISCWREAEVITRALHDNVHLSITLGNLASAFKDAGEMDLALEMFKEATELDRNTGDYIGLSKHLSKMAAIYREREQYDLAISLYEESIAIVRKESERYGLAVLLMNQAGFFVDLEKPHAALRNLGEAEPIARELKDEKLLGSILQMQGSIFVSEKEHHKALKKLMEAEGLLRKVGNEKELTNNVFEQACACTEIKGYKRAKALFEEAYSLAKKLDIHATMVSAHHNLNYVYSELGEKDKAKESYLSIIKEFEQSENMEGLVSSLCNLASLYKDDNQSEEAMATYKRVIELTKGTSHYTAYAVATRSVALALFKQHKWEEALELYKEESLVLDEVKDNENVRTNLVNQAFIYRKQKKYDLALPLYLKAEKMIRKAGKRAELLLPLNELGAIYQDQRRHKLAIDKWKEAENIAKKTGNKHELIIIIHNQAGSLFSLGLKNLAYRRWMDAIEVAKKDQNIPMLVTMYENIVRPLKDEKKWKKALEIYNELEQLYQKSGNTEGVKEAQKNQSILKKVLDMGTVNKPNSKSPTSHIPGRNEKCTCNSGKKYKACCGR